MRKAGLSRTYRPKVNHLQHWTLLIPAVLVLWVKVQSECIENLLAVCIAYLLRVAGNQAQMQWCLKTVGARCGDAWRPQVQHAVMLEHRRCKVAWMATKMMRERSLQQLGLTSFADSGVNSCLEGIRSWAICATGDGIILQPFLGFAG